MAIMPEKDMEAIVAAKPNNARGVSRLPTLTSPSNNQTLFVRDRNKSYSL
jgi:hypothetical protein